MQKLDWKPKNKSEKAGVRIVRLLAREHHQAFFVGGVIRNWLLKQETDNIDIATDALPDEVEEILERAGISYKQIGKKFGTILAVVDGALIEVTTFRREGRYSDQRHPDQVEFIREYLDDARRRDLTINAMYFNPLTRELFDPVNGLTDLGKKLIRFVGDPKKRIDEDPLRMMRAVRFAVQFGFKIEKNSFAAIKTRAKLIQSVSPERIKQELDKLMLSTDRGFGIELLDAVGLLKFLLPEFVKLKKVFHLSKKYHLEGSVFDHTLILINSLPPDLDLVYAGLFHDLGKISTGTISERDGERVMKFPGHQEESRKLFLGFAHRFRFSRLSRERIAWLVKHHDDRPNYVQMRPKKQIKYSLHPDFTTLVELWRADAFANVRLVGGKKIHGESDVVIIADAMCKKINSKQRLLRKMARGEFVISETKLAPGIKVGQLIEQIKLRIILGEIKNLIDAKKFLQKFSKKVLDNGNKMI